MTQATTSKPLHELRQEMDGAHKHITPGLKKGFNLDLKTGILKDETIIKLVDNIGTISNKSESLAGRIEQLNKKPQDFFNQQKQFVKNDLNPILQQCPDKDREGIINNYMGKEGPLHYFMENASDAEFEDYMKERKEIVAEVHQLDSLVKRVSGWWHSLTK